MHTREEEFFKVEVPVNTFDWIAVPRDALAARDKKEAIEGKTKLGDWLPSSRSDPSATNPAVQKTAACHTFSSTEKPP